MRIADRTRWLRLLPFVLGLLFLDAPLFGQSSGLDPFIAATPFHTWLATTPRPQIPWKVEFLPLQLSYYQRITLRIRIQVPGKELLLRVSRGGFSSMIQATDGAGQIYQDHTVLEPQDLEKQVRKGTLELIWNMLVVPGEYRVALALYDQSTGEYSFMEQLVTVPPLKDDPLPGAWSDSPSLQFFNPDKDQFKVFLATPPARLNLPLRTRRSLHLEVIVNLTPAENAAESLTRYTHDLVVLLGALAAFTQLDLRNGSLRVETLDLSRRRVIFEQENVRELDWPRLQSAVGTMDPSRIDVASLEHRGENAAFLALELQRRLDQAARAAASGEPAPLSVYIIVSSPTGLEPGTEPSPLALPEGSDCLVYYIYGIYSEQFARSRAGRFPIRPYPRPRDDSRFGYDDIGKLLKPLKPRVFRSASPEEFRSALAKLIAEVSAN